MQLFYREKGNPALPTLIIWHGLWGASENWLPVAERLADYFHVFLPDFRNHGFSPWSDEHDYEILSEDILSFTEQFSKEKKLFLAGHSMGGKALMLALLKRPEMAAKVAIIDICPKEYPLMEKQMHYKILEFIQKYPVIPIKKRTDTHQFIRQYFPSEEFCQLLFKNLKRTSEGFGWKINATVIQNNLRQLMSWPLSGPDIPYILPVLFIKGETSDYIQSSDLSLIRSYFPFARLDVLSHSSHRIHAEHPTLLAQVLTDFFLSK